MTPRQRYQNQLSLGQIRPDPYQQTAVEALERVFHELETLPIRAKPVKDWRFWRSPVTPASAVVNGVYLWGGVGRGKTFLMDLLVECCPPGAVIRLHFYHFMQQIHQRLQALQGQINPLKVVAKEFAERTRLLCFDEFFVTDITDAMLLGTLFEALFHEGVGLVATSNVPPKGLYENGLQRSRFLPAIALIEQHCEVLQLEGNEDYRRQPEHIGSRYYWPLEPASDEHLKQWFTGLTGGAPATPRQLEVNAHQLKIKGRCGRVLYLSFNELCRTARNSNDYIELAQRFQVVLIDAIPSLDDDDNDAVRRFIMWVDECYEQKVALIISAQENPLQIYHGKRLAFEWQRCASRLMQLNSQQFSPLQFPLSAL